MSLKIAAFQGNPTVGDFEKNLGEIQAAYERAKAGGAEVVVFPEMFLTGYPPEDLVLRRSFWGAADGALQKVKALTADGGPDILLPTLGVVGDKTYNAVYHISAGGIQNQTFKKHLPNYGVFDELRHFESGEPVLFTVRGYKIGVAICEDIWHPDVCQRLTQLGAQIIISPNGSPYEQDKDTVRKQIASARVRETGIPLVYLNLVGGQDEIVFDGRSFAFQGDGSGAFMLPAWQEAGVMFTLAVNPQTKQPYITDITMVTEGVVSNPVGVEDTTLGLILGLRDYVEKNHFKTVVLGLSGGIDSAVVAGLAVRALGADRVRAVMIPSEHTSRESIELAKECAEELGIRYDFVDRRNFKEVVESLSRSVAGLCPESAPEGVRGPYVQLMPSVALENIHARARGVILMGVSNETGAMLLTTGNKSEMSVGYATLYGDMSGGFNPLKDVYKTQVFAIARWLTTTGTTIPYGIIVRPPTAELSAGQQDTDTLPPYPVLDVILTGLVDHERSIQEVANETDQEHELVESIARKAMIAEYKRRQAAPGIKITKRNFGRDRRYPITNGFEEW